MAGPGSAGGGSSVSGPIGGTSTPDSGGGSPVSGPIGGTGAGDGSPPGPGASGALVGGGQHVEGGEGAGGGSTDGGVVDGGALVGGLDGGVVDGGVLVGGSSGGRLILGSVVGGPAVRPGAAVAGRPGESDEDVSSSWAGGGWVRPTGSCVSVVVGVEGDGGPFADRSSACAEAAWAEDGLSSARRYESGVRSQFTASAACPASK
jgi:hypothetical protein